MDKVIPFERDASEMPVVSTAKTSFISGLILAGCLIVYFLILKLVNLVPVIELRIVDFLILSIGIFIAFRHYQAKTKEDVKYLQGLLFGTSVSAFATIPFALFMAAYFQWLDPQLLIKLKDNSPLLGTFISPFKIAVTTIVGGMGWGMVLSFLLMQYFQKDSHQLKSDEQK